MSSPPLERGYVETVVVQVGGDQIGGELSEVLQQQPNSVARLHAQHRRGVQAVIEGRKRDVLAGDGKLRRPNGQRCREDAIFARDFGWVGER